MKRSVLYIISTLQKTGPVNVLYDIVKNLNRDNYEPIILTLSAEKKDSIKSLFEDLNIKIYCLNFKGMNMSIKKFVNMINIINPDLIHTHCFRSSLLTAIGLVKNYKTIATIHCDYDTDYRFEYGKIIGYFMARLMDFALNRIDVKICVSEFLYKILSKKKKYLQTIFINNGIDSQKYVRNSNKIDIRNKLGIPCDKTVFIWSGRLIERKNPLLLAEAIKQLKNNENFYIFCGDGNLKSQLKDTLNDFTNILLTGQINNIEEYLQSADYYISTSLSEGLPLSVLEAMSCGLPVILSDIPQHKFLFSNKNFIGELFTSENLSELCSAITNITKLDYKKLSTCAEELIKSNFSSKLMAQRYENIYKSLLEDISNE